MFNFKLIIAALDYFFDFLKCQEAQVLVLTEILQSSHPKEDCTKLVCARMLNSKLLKENKN